MRRALPIAQVRSGVRERVGQWIWAVRHSTRTGALVIVALAIALGGAGFTARAAYRMPERLVAPVVVRDLSIAPGPPAPPLPPRRPQIIVPITPKIVRDFR